MTGSRRISLRGGCNTITPPMPTRDAYERCLREMVRSPYWINGKAGSGKSTLMRFVYCSPCTQQALHKRTGNLELALFLSGRFWGAGSRSWVEDTPPPKLTQN